jgi:hypothetical protein
LACAALGFSITAIMAIMAILAIPVIL